LPLPGWKEWCRVFDFRFFVSPDMAKLERMMSELNENMDEIKAAFAAETEQGKALQAKIDELQVKVDTLLSDTYAKAEVNAAFDEIKALIPGVVPDAPVSE
jgi:chromosome segregation ATPase